jgi:plasmid replication initiation protein
MKLEAVFKIPPSKTMWESNSLIEARRSFTALQEKIMVLLCDQVLPTDLPHTLYKLELAKVSEMTELNSRNWGEIRNSIVGLVTKPIRIPLDNGYEITTVLTRTIWIEGSNSIELEISPNLLPYLVNLKSNFTKYDRDILLGLTNIPSIKLYKLICKNIFKKKWKVSVTELKDLLEMENKYPNFSDFRKRVIHQGLNELKQRGFDVSFTELKGDKGKKIEMIEFYILSDIINGVPVEEFIEKVKKQDEVVKIEYPPLPDYIIKCCTKLGLSPKQMELLRPYPHREIGKVLHKLEIGTTEMQAHSWDVLKGHLSIKEPKGFKPY